MACGCPSFSLLCLRIVVWILSRILSRGFFQGSLPCFMVARFFVCLLVYRKNCHPLSDWLATGSILSAFLLSPYQNLGREMLIWVSHSPPNHNSIVNPPAETWAQLPELAKLLPRGPCMLIVHLPLGKTNPGFIVWSIYFSYPPLPPSQKKMSPLRILTTLQHGQIYLFRWSDPLSRRWMLLGLKALALNLNSVVARFSRWTQTV